MQKEFLKLMKERYEDLLTRAKVNNALYNDINELKKDEKVRKYIELYSLFEERGIKGLEDDRNVLKNTIDSFSSDINDMQESDTNKIYFLTRRDVYQIRCSKAGFVYDSEVDSRGMSIYDEVLDYKFGDIFMNIENDKYWIFVSKEEQENFKKLFRVIIPEDCSLYYLAHKDFYETAIKEGQEEAIKRVLSKRY